MEKTDRGKYSEQFENIFHEKPQQFMEIINWELSLDIFKFEIFLSKKWYVQWSMSDFVRDKYWKEAEDLIYKMF